MTAARCQLRRAMAWSALMPVPLTTIAKSNAIVKRNIVGSE
jgi:hypothetical protein